MQNFTEYDFIQEASGMDINGESKCIVSVRHQRCDADGVLTEVEEEFISEKPVVQIFKQSGGLACDAFVCVDFIFRSVEDRDLKIIYAYLDRFFSASNSVSDDGSDFPLFSLTITPHSLEGKFFALGLNPIFYALTPEDSTGEPRIIRMVFVSQDDPDALPNFLFLRSADDVLADIQMQADENEEDGMYY